jgi:sugar/nucleoside kinase (ribokinase family)
MRLYMSLEPQQFAMCLSWTFTKNKQPAVFGGFFACYAKCIRDQLVTRPIGVQDCDARLPSPQPERIVTSMPSLLAVGSVAIDSIKTPFGSRQRSLGGSATHFSVAASFLTDVGIVAVIGEDFTKEDEAVFRERDVDTSDLKRVVGGKTFFWAGEYGFDLNAAQTLDTQLNVFGDFNPTLSAAACKSPFLFLGNIQPTLQRQVREQVDAKFVAMDTMNLWIETTRDELLKTIAVVDALIINDAEARQLAQEPNLIRAAKIILDMGPKMLLVKRGEHGAAFFTDDNYFAIPAYPLENVFDPTGAGDSFAGGFMGYIAQCEEIDNMAIRCGIIYGSIMASFNVEEFSCDRLRRLKPAEIRNRLAQFKEFTHFELDETTEFLRRAKKVSTAAAR